MSHYSEHSPTWSHTTSPLQKTNNMTDFVSFHGQGALAHYMSSNDHALPSGIVKLVISPGQYLVPPQELFSYNNQALSDPEVQTVLSSSESEYLVPQSAHRYSVSSYDQDFDYYSCPGVSFSHLNNAIDPNLVFKGPDIGDMTQEYNEPQQSYRLTYDYPQYDSDNARYSPVYDSTYYNHHTGYVERYHERQDMERSQVPNPDCHSSYSNQSSSCDTHYPQVRRYSGRHGKQFKFPRREGSASSSDNERKQGRGRTKLPKKQKPQHVCNDCPGKAFRNKSDLRKHRETQHTKPYNCFFKSCDKKFGARNEWKRHINTQHVQLAVWKCDYSQCSDKPEFNRKDLFNKHLERMHKAVSKKRSSRNLEAQLKEEFRLAEQRCMHPRTPPQSCTCGYCGQQFKGEDQAWSTFIDHVGLHYQNGDECAEDRSNWKEDRDLTQWCNDHGLEYSAESSMDIDCSDSCSQSDCSGVKIETSD